MLDGAAWLLPPADLALSPAEVQVWGMDLNRCELLLEPLAALLSVDEQGRAQRFRFRRDRDCFSLCRGILRLLLGRYLNRAAATLQFSYGTQGKPALVAEPGEPLLTFNLSHSGQLALFAFRVSQHHCEDAASQPLMVGVDVEKIRPLEFQSLARRFFTTAESDFLKSLPLAQQETAFFAFWTCKESYLKATGEGIGRLGRVQITLPLTAAVSPSLEEQGDRPPSCFALRSLPMPPGYVAHVAFNHLPADPLPVLSCWQIVPHQMLEFLRSALPS